MHAATVHVFLSVEKPHRVASSSAFAALHQMYMRKQRETTTIAACRGDRFMGYVPIIPELLNWVIAEAGRSYWLTMFY